MQLMKAVVFIVRVDITVSDDIGPPHSAFGVDQL